MQIKRKQANSRFVKSRLKLKFRLKNDYILFKFGRTEINVWTIGICFSSDSFQIWKSEKETFLKAFNDSVSVVLLVKYNYMKFTFRRIKVSMSLRVVALQARA